MNLIKIVFFNLFMAVTAILYSVTGAVIKPFTRFPFRFSIVSGWAKINIKLMGPIWGLRYEVEGLENIPEGNAIILAKHQSTWETMAFQAIFPPQTWVLKKELLRIPFFGWGLASLDPVAIDRGQRKKAMEQVIEQGKQRLKDGYWLVIFPEGTRTPAGWKGKYKLGGARLAEATGFPVLPVAHNAGEYWGKGQFSIKAGTIKVRIGKPIDPKGMTSDDLMASVENWIEQQMNEITDPKLLPIKPYDKSKE